MKYLQYVASLVDVYVSYNKQKRLYMIAATASLFLCMVGGLVWYTMDTADTIIKKIEQVYRLRTKNADIIARYEKAQEEERLFIEKVNERKDLSIKTYFEKFIKEHNLSPEGNWAETEKNPIPDNDLFEEEILRATFKAVTAETIVQMLLAIDKENIVEVTTVALKKDQNLITLDLVLAMKKFKKVIDEA